MSVPVFSPNRGPGTYSTTYPAFVDTSPTQMGYLLETQHSVLIPITAVVLWPTLSDSDREYFDSFFLQELGGATGPFEWTPPHKIASPTGTSPTLEAVSSGALSARTYDVTFTWYDAAGETKESASSTLALSANEVIKVTVPIMPRGADGWRVYVTDSSAGITEERQASVTDSQSWQEPDSGLVDNSENPPAGNTLKPARKWRLASPYAPALVGSRHDRWQVRLDLREVLI